MKYQQFILRLADKADVGDIIRMDFEEQIEKLNNKNYDLWCDIHERDIKIDELGYHITDLLEENELLLEKLYYYEPWENDKE